jgi:hypothetical protein
MRPGGEDCAQDRSDPLRFLVNLLATQTLHIESERAQLEISSPVVVERLPTAVVLIAIRFNHEPEISPDEIRLILAELNVDLRKRQAVSSADPQEVALEVAAGAVVWNVLTERQAEHLRLPNRPPHLSRGNHATEIEDRLRWPRDGNAATPSHVAGGKRGAPMQTDSGTPRPTSISADRDIYEAACGFQQIPKLSGAPMADNRAIANGESSSHPSTVLRDSGVADGVHTAVNSMESTCFYATNHTGSAQSRFL